MMKAAIVRMLPLMLAVSCCNSLPRELREFMALEISIPSDMLCIEEGHVISASAVSDSAVLVIYHGRNECSSCTIAHMYDNLSALEEISSCGKCRVMVIFSPPEDDVLDIIDKIRALKYPFPLYVDQYGDFARLNPDLPADKRFHSFLIGSSRHPVFVGNPSGSGRLYALFVKVLGSLEKE